MGHDLKTGGLGFLPVSCSLCGAVPVTFSALILPLVLNSCYACYKITGICS